MTDQVKVKCSSCGQRYKVRPDKLGKKMPCGKCGETFTLQTKSPAIESVATPSVSRTKKVAEAETASGQGLNKAMAASEDFVEGLRVNPHKSGLTISFVGIGFLFLSLPLTWIQIYSSGFAGNRSINTHGWMIAIPVIILLGLVLGIKQKPEKANTFAKTVGGLCLMIFLYAAYTVFSTMSVSSTDVGRVHAGIKTGMGVWLAILGSIVCGVGQVFITQADLISATDADGKSRSWKESLKEIGERAEQTAKQTSASISDSNNKTDND